MTRCSNYLTCTVVGFNFGYVTLAIGIIGISFVRRITADPIKYSLHLLNVVTGQKDEWEYPFQVYMYASFIPVGCSIVGLLLAFAWVALVRPAVYPSWRTNILCKESTSVLFVIMMMAYTGALFPGPIKGLKYSEILNNETAAKEFKDGMVEALRTERYYIDTENVSPIGEYKPTKFGEAMDFLQRKYGCCGIHGYTDYTATHFLLTANFKERYNIPIPFSCCQEFDTQDNETMEPIQWDQCSRLAEGYYYNKSCSEDIMGRAREAYYILEGAGFSAATIGIIAVVFSVIFATMNLIMQFKHEKFKDEAGPNLKRRGDRRA